MDLGSALRCRQRAARPVRIRKLPALPADFGRFLPRASSAPGPASMPPCSAERAILPGAQDRTV